uniref:Uncharacterized protein n=1 Tax=Steinernema glaseri TaxID=37863 RepID=A0A1I7Y7Y9_9BILA
MYSRHHAAEARILSFSSADSTLTEGTTLKANTGNIEKDALLQIVFLFIDFHGMADSAMVDATEAYDD